MNTRVDYMYRCGGNYKYPSYFILEGLLSQSEIKILMDKGDEFIPEQIGLDALQPEIWDEELDHPYHEIICVEITDEPSFGHKYDAKDFYNKFISAEWDESLSTAREDRVSE